MSLESVKSLGSTGRSCTDFGVLPPGERVLTTRRPSFCSSALDVLYTLLRITLQLSPSISCEAWRTDARVFVKTFVQALIPVVLLCSASAFSKAKLSREMGTVWETFSTG